MLSFLSHCCPGTAFVENAYETILPRVIINIDKETYTIHVQRMPLHKQVHALSHRWINRDKDGIQTWTVCCKDEQDYEALIYPHEVSHLQSYLKQFQVPLWLDYICINQSSNSDKNAQVSIMGGIYLNYTTLIVGNDLDPVLPAEDYFGRGWTFQERKFGKIKFPFDITTIKGQEVIDLGYKFVVAIPDLTFCADKLLGDFLEAEQWRVQIADDVIARLRKQGEEEKAELVLRAKELMVQSKREELAMIALQYRFLLDIDYLPDDRNVFGGGTPDVVKYQIEMFNVNVSFRKDCLFGVWGVPMVQKKITLDYSDPMSSWRSIAKAYPWANFAFYSKENTAGEPFLSFSKFADVETVVGCLMSDGSNEQYMQPKAAKILETTVHRFYHENETKFTLAWGESCVGVACKHGCNEALPDGPFHFVVGYETLEVTETESSYFSFKLNFRTTVSDAFHTLVKKMSTLDLCQHHWKEGWHMQHEMAITLRDMSKKYECIAKYNKHFQFPPNDS